jgi:hypothetical protein
MANSTTWLLVGVGVGVSLGIGAAILWQQRQNRSQGDEAGVVSHDVRRGPEGRIMGVETYRQPLSGVQAPVVEERNG